MNPDDKEDIMKKLVGNIYGGGDYNSAGMQGENAMAALMKIVGMAKEAETPETPEKIAKKFDVSKSLDADVLAKLALVHGDCVVIPVDKLEELKKEYSK